MPRLKLSAGIWSPTYRVFPLLPGGKMGPELDLRGLFVQFCAEAVAPAADAAVVAALKDMARG